MTKAQRLLQQALKTQSVEELREKMASLKALMDHPFGPDADRHMEAEVGRLIAMAYDGLGETGILAMSRLPMWIRILQIRFLQLICADRPSVAAAVGAELEGDKRPPVERLMREAVRRSLLDIIEAGLANQASPKRQATPVPKRADYHWQKAFEELSAEVGTMTGQGKTIKDTPAGSFSILGADYSLEAVPD
jgi:hypothetical protein